MRHLFIYIFFIFLFLLFLLLFLFLFLFLISYLQSRRHHCNSIQWQSSLTILSDVGCGFRSADIAGQTSPWCLSNWQARGTQSPQKSCGLTILAFPRDVLGCTFLESEKLSASAVTWRCCWRTCRNFWKLCSAPCSAFQPLVEYPNVCRVGRVKHFITFHFRQCSAVYSTVCTVYSVTK